MTAESTHRKGGRPKGDPDAVRVHRVNARLSPAELEELKAKANEMGMTPAQWLRVGSLSRRLPSPPVSAVNREQYSELSRLAANLNQLTRLANSGQSVVLSSVLVTELIGEVRRLRMSLIGLEKSE